MNIRCGNFPSISAPNMLDRITVDDLLHAISRRMTDQWQLDVPSSTIQLHYETDQGYDVILNQNSSVLGVLQTYRPKWKRRQYDAFLSVDHPNQWIPFICRSDPPAWRDVVIITDFSTLSSLAAVNWNYYAMDPRNHVSLTTMEERALWQYAKYVYVNQVDTFTFDTILEGVLERVEEQWQVHLTTDDLEIRFDTSNGLEVIQVTRDQDFWNLRELLGCYRPDWQTHQHTYFMGETQRHPSPYVAK
eukprot:s181_g10.t1